MSSFELKDWFKKNPKFFKANAEFLTRKIKLGWSLPSKPLKILNSNANPYSPNYCKHGKSENRKKYSANFLAPNAKKKRNYKYTELRKQREDFRKSLLSILANETTVDGERGDGNALDLLGSQEALLLKYRYYIEFGADASNIGPMSLKLVDRIQNLIPKKFDERTELKAKLMEEVKSEYGLAIRTAIVNFAIGDSEQLLFPAKNEYFTNRNMFQKNDDRKSYIERYRQNRSLLKRDLFSINPCIAHMLRIWQRTYSEKHFVSSELIEAHDGAYNLLELISFVNVEIIETKMKLSKSWYDNLRDTFTKGTKKKHTPSISNARSLARFFNCVAALMRQNLQDICTRSLKHFTEYICGGVKRTRCIRLHVLLETENKMVFQPSFSKIEAELIGVIDRIVGTVTDFPRLENKLYLDSVKSQTSPLSPYIPPEAISTCKTKIRRFLERQRIAPEASLADYNEFQDLMNGKDIEFIREFLRKNPSFEEIREKFEKYREISERIYETLWIVKVIDLYEFHREKLNDTLEILAKFMQTELLARMLDVQQFEMRDVEQQYGAIFNRILTSPKTTAELMKLVQDLKQHETVTFPYLEGRIIQNTQHFLWLMDFQIYSPVQRKQNSLAILMYLQLPSTLEECQILIKTRTYELQEELKIKVQQLRRDLTNYAKEIIEFDNFGDISHLTAYQKKIFGLNKKLEVATDRIEQINEEELSFEWPLSQYPERREIFDKLAPLKTFFNAAAEFIEKRSEWLSSVGGTFEAEVVTTDTDVAYKQIQKIEKRFDGTPMLEKICSDVKKEITSFKKHLPMVQVFGNTGLKPRHWANISELTNIPMKKIRFLTLDGLINLNLSDHLEQLMNVTDKATKEMKIERAILKMKDEWKDIKFVCAPYKDTGTYILSSVEDVETLLDDHLIKTQAIKLSPNIANFEEELTAWEMRLRNLLEILEDWLKVQMGWMYLEPIFTSGDIQQQIPEESRRYNVVDRIWIELMDTVNRTPLSIDVGEIANINLNLKKALSLLEAIQKGLNAYLEKKRLYFPRFFFLSNDEMLEILSETKDPSRVQPHLKKCFEGIATLEFSDDLEIVKMRSSEGEEVELDEIISTSKARGQVEKWLLELERSMRKSVQRQAQNAIEDYADAPRQFWVLKWPGQCIQAISITFWTSNITACFLSEHPTESLQSYSSQCDDQIANIVALVRGHLSVQNRITLGALIVLDVHASVILKELIDKKTTSVRDFHWMSQLRYYWSNNSLETQMINSTLKYGYEYLGNTTRLVITPLTDRCYRTLFGALHLHLGGAPEGPAGTGKTETTKDLAKAVAKQCVVFNCSDGLDYIALGKFFKGLASCGAWSCFDEFNRIDLEVLSVVAQQILTIQRGINSGEPTLMFEGTLIHLDPTCATFITMNPGYAGRSDLPDNLKALFRSVAMMVPDYALIAEIELYSYGFINAKVMAVKIVATYKLCSEQLSTQPHYDYGMRAVKSVLKAAGNLKLMLPDEAEDTIVVRSIKDINKAKFLNEDVLLFQVYGFNL